MTASEENELRALRERVYGPGGNSDVEAILRLQQLEEARRPLVPSRVVESPEPEPGRVDRPEPEPSPEPNRLEPAARWVLRRLQTLRRSTVLIILGAVALATAIAVVLTVVQRVQTGPLQISAEEVARLSPDPTYQVPDIFAAGPDGDIEVRAYEPFHGLRSTMSVGGVFSRGNGECLAVFSEADFEDLESTSFSGALLGGCEAGGFPANAQFDTNIDGLPAELLEALPDTGLQFVYDGETDEVVVYATMLTP